MHESCHFTVRSTRGASMTQIGELTFYDQSGSKIDVASISSECEPITGESAYEAVDGSAYTKWLCSPFAYPVPDAPKCDDDCLSSSNGICSDGGPGAEYSSCDFGTDCTDCGARNYTAPTLTIDFVGRHVVHTYELTTAEDEPDRDPTSWTLACRPRPACRPRLHATRPELRSTRPATSPSGRFVAGARSCNLPS
jgi:hypothetical protein